MHVKESVKEFVHDVKRRFSQKRRRDSCSTCAIDDNDGASSTSSSDSYSHRDPNRDSTSSSSISSLPSTPEQSRFATFIRSRTASTSSKKHPNLLHKVRRTDSQRQRLFSSDRGRRTQPGSGPPRSRSMLDERKPVPREYPDVIDISARASSGEEGGPSSQGSSMHDSLLQPASHKSSLTSTLISTASESDQNKVNSESDLHPVIVDVESQIALSTPSVTMPAEHLPSPPKPELEPPVPQPVISVPTSPAPVYLPRLTAPSMFLPVPNTDPLSAHLTKYVPAEQRPRRDVAGEYAGRDLHEMVMSNSWRALAKMSRDRIVASDPEDLSRILDLWSLRLSSLARLRLTNQASAECTNLFAVLNAVPPPTVPGSFPGSAPAASMTLPSSPTAAVSPLSPSGLSGLVQLPGTPSQKPSTLPAAGAPPSRDVMHPFELTVFHARIHYWSGDHLAYVDTLCRILSQCKERAREEARTVAQRRELQKRAAQQDASQPNSEATSDESGAPAQEDSDTENAEIPQEQAPDEDEGAPERTMSTEIADGEDHEESDDVLIAAEANLSMWLERVARVCLILASQMIEMNDYQAAINLLVPLCTHRVAPASWLTPSPALYSALARVYLLSGNLGKAEAHFAVAASATDGSTNGTDYIIMNAALLAAGSGDWARAEEALGELVDKDPGNFMAINNLAVVLLYQGRIKEGIDLLEGALKMSPSSVVVAEPFLFNLSTLYELRSAAAIDRKRALLVEVAKWSGDGLRTSCLKMPSS